MQCSHLTDVLTRNIVVSKACYKQDLLLYYKGMETDTLPLRNDFDSPKMIK